MGASNPTPSNLSAADDLGRGKGSQGGEVLSCLETAQHLLTELGEQRYPERRSCHTLTSAEVRPWHLLWFLTCWINRAFIYVLYH